MVTEYQNEALENCLRTFAMMVLYHREIIDSDIAQAMQVIKSELELEDE